MRVRVRVQQTVEVDVVFVVEQGTDDGVLASRAMEFAKENIVPHESYFDDITSTARVIDQQITQTKVFF